jgi:hypothetical protein
MTTMAQVQANRAKAGMLPPLTPNAAGAYGYDPITQAPITDQYAAARFNDPGTAQPLASYMRGNSAPLPPLPSGGSPGGRMGPQQPRRKIMTLGPRTTAEYTAENGGLSAQRPSALNNAYSTGNLTTGLPPLPTAQPTTPPLPELPGGGYNVDLAQFDPPQDKPKPMAKGGPMKMGTTPYLVGEEGPELILPRDNGDAYVLPADVTAQILPTLPGVKPRKEGGIMQSPSGRFAGFTSPDGSGFASRIPNSDGINLMASDTPRLFVDPATGYQIDPAQPGMPILPDTVSGPYAEPGAPVTPEMRTDLTQATAGRAQALTAAPGTIAQSRYPGQLFPDAAPNAPAQMIPFEELQQRVADRSIDANNTLFDIRDRAARDRVQMDLAARANRAPLGTPTSPLPQLPGLPAMRPSTQQRLDRNQERFLRTPEGAQFAMQSGQKVQERMGMIQPVPVGDSGDFIIPLTGQYVSANGQQRQMTPDEASEFGLVAQSAENGVIRYGRPDTQTTRSGGFQLVPGTYDAEGNLAPARVFDTYTGLSWNEGDPVPQESIAARGGQPIKAPEVGGAATDPAKPTAPAATGAKSRVKALMERRKPTP